jgi:hypothetical protein
MEVKMEVIKWKIYASHFSVEDAHKIVHAQ